MERNPASHPQGQIGEAIEADVVDDKPQVVTPLVVNRSNPAQPRSRSSSISIAGLVCLATGSFQLIGSLVILWVIRGMVVEGTVPVDNLNLASSIALYCGTSLLGIFLGVAGGFMQFRRLVSLKVGLGIAVFQLLLMGLLTRLTFNPGAFFANFLSMIVVLAILLEWGRLGQQMRRTRRPRKAPEKENESAA